MDRDNELDLSKEPYFLVGCDDFIPFYEKKVFDILKEGQFCGEVKQDKEKAQEFNLYITSLHSLLFLKDYYRKNKMPNVSDVQPVLLKRLCLCLGMGKFHLLYLKPEPLFCSKCPFSVSSSKKP